jgi:hypothetical protein
MRQSRHQVRCTSQRLGHHFDIICIPIYREPAPAGKRLDGVHVQIDHERFQAALADDRVGGLTDRTISTASG